MRSQRSDRLPIRAALALVAVAGAPALAQQPQQQVRPPIAQYWMDVATSNMSIPGMPSAASGGAGMLGSMMGGMAGGGRGGFGGAGRSLDLSLYTRNKPEGADGRHATPPPSRFDSPLPLVPFRVQRDPGTRTPTEPGEEIEKPKLRMLMYWGCGDSVRTGQPRVIDTASMSPVEFGRAMTSRGATDRSAARAAGRSVWPNATDRRTVAQDASLLGGHKVTGDGVPDINFGIAAAQDFMAPVELTLTGEPASSVLVEWKPIPTARAYFAQAMGSRGEGEMVIWTSSEVPETGFGLIDYLPNNLVERWLGERVLMPTSTTRCAIPKGIFAGVEGAMVRFIGYGEELHLVHPPRPSDPRVTWEQIWAARVRVKSTGMGMLEAGESQSARRDERSRRSSERAPADSTQSKEATEGASQPSGQGGILPGVSPTDLLRGILRR